MFFFEKQEGVSLSQAGIPVAEMSVKYSSSSNWGTLSIYTDIDSYSVDINDTVSGVKMAISQNLPTFRTNNDYSSIGIAAFTLTLNNCQISNVNKITTDNCSMQIVQVGSNVEIRITNVDTNDDSLQYAGYGYGTLTINGQTLSEEVRFIIEGSHY